MNPVMEDPESTWAIEIGRPIIHQMFPDGLHVIHICRGGGKSRIHSDLLQDFIKVEQAGRVMSEGRSKGHTGVPLAAVKAAPAPYYRQFDNRKF